CEAADRECYTVGNLHFKAWGCGGPTSNSCPFPPSLPCSFPLRQRGRTAGLAPPAKGGTTLYRTFNNVGTIVFGNEAYHIPRLIPEGRLVAVPVVRGDETSPASLARLRKGGIELREVLAHLVPDRRDERDRPRGNDADKQAVFNKILTLLIAHELTQQ